MMGVLKRILLVAADGLTKDFSPVSSLALLNAHHPYGMGRLPFNSSISVGDFQRSLGLLVRVLGHFPSSTIPVA